LRPPSPSLAFTLAGGVSGSSQAERIDKLHSFFTVKELLRAKRCDDKARPDGFTLIIGSLFSASVGAVMDYNIRIGQ
jgi:hypothetical protein